MTIDEIPWRLESTLGGLYHVFKYSPAIYFSSERVGKNPTMYGVHYFDRRIKAKFYTDEQFKEYLKPLNINYLTKVGEEPNNE